MKAKRKQQIYIYKLVDPNTNEPFYVGQTISLERRIKEHTLGRDTNMANITIIKKMKNNNLAPFIKLIEEVEPKRADDIEMFWINELGKKYNLTNVHLHQVKDLVKRYCESKILAIKCDSKQQKQARKLLNLIKDKTSESHIFIILRALRSIEKTGQIDY